MSEPFEDLDDSPDEDVVEGIEILESSVDLSSDVIVDSLRTSSQWSEADEVVTDGSISWRPVLRDVHDSDLLLHVHLASELRSYLRDRLAMATSVGKRVVVALPLEALYESDIVEFLGDIDADVIVIDPADHVPSPKSSHLLTALSDNSVAVNHATRTVIASKAWQRRTEGTNHEKGRRFEGLLAFLLHQVGDFRVVERNLRAATEEIDLVIQIDNWSARCWHQSGAPFVLVEAKNWTNPVGKPEITDFKAALRTKRQRARIGLIFSASTFTRDAEMEELKYAQDAEVIVMVDGKQLAKWIESDEPDDELEELVRRAMLR